MARHGIKPPPRVTGAAVVLFVALLCTVAIKILFGSRASDPDGASSSDLQTEDIGVMMKDLRAVVCALTLTLTTLHLARHKLLNGEHSVTIRFARHDLYQSRIEIQGEELETVTSPGERKNMTDEARRTVLDRPIDMYDVMLCVLLSCAAAGLLLTEVVVPVLLTLGRPVGAWIAAGCSMLGCSISILLSGHESWCGVYHAKDHVGWLRAGRFGCKSKPWTIHMQNPKDGLRFYCKNAVTKQSSRQLGHDENGAIWTAEPFNFDEWVDAGMQDGQYNSQSPWTRFSCGTQCYYQKLGQTNKTMQAPHQGIRDDKIGSQHKLLSAKLLDDLKIHGHYDESSAWIQCSYNNRSYYLHSESELTTLRQPGSVCAVCVYDGAESQFEREWREAEGYDSGELSLDSMWQEVRYNDQTDNGYDYDAQDYERSYFVMVGEGDRQSSCPVLTLQRPAEGARRPVYKSKYFSSSFARIWLEAEQQDLLRSTGHFNPGSLWEEVACRNAVCYSACLQLSRRRNVFICARKLPTMGAYTRRLVDCEQFEQILKDAEEFGQQPGDSIDSTWVRVSDGRRCYFECCRLADPSSYIYIPELSTQNPPEGVLHTTHEERPNVMSSDDDETSSDRARKDARPEAEAESRPAPESELQTSAYSPLARYEVGDECQVFSTSAEQWFNGRVVCVDKSKRIPVVDTEFVDMTTGETRRENLRLDSTHLRQYVVSFAERFAQAERQDALRQAGEYDRDSTMVCYSCDDNRAYYKDTKTGRLSLQRPRKLRDVIIDIPGPCFEQQLARAQKYDDGILNVDSEWLKISCDARTYYAKGQERGSTGCSLIAPSEGVREEVEDFGTRFDDGYSRAEKLDAGELSATSTWAKWISGSRTLYVNMMLTVEHGADGVECVRRGDGHWVRIEITSCYVENKRRHVAACRSVSDAGKITACFHSAPGQNYCGGGHSEVHTRYYGGRQWFQLENIITAGQISFVRPPEGITDEILSNDSNDRETFNYVWKGAMAWGGGAGSE